MFEAVGDEPFPYSDPWDIPYERRLRMLTRRTRRIGYFYERPDTSTFRYRVFNMVRALEVEAGCDTSAAWFHRDDIDKSLEFIDRCDALVIGRTRMSPSVDRMISRARRRGIRILFDTDDLVFDVRYARLIMETLAQDAEPEEAQNFWYAYFSRLGATLKQCDGVISTNDFLAEKIRNFHPDGYTKIIPNYLNEQQQSFSNSLYEVKKSNGFRSANAWHIGYFSGSPTHVLDFKVAAPAIRNLMKRYPKLRLVLVGFMELDASFEPLLDRIDRFPLQDFMNLQRLIAQTEINIAPLQDNDFTNCKSELKYFEAAVVGTITVATPTYTFKQAIIDQKNGYLSFAQDWDEKLEGAVQLLKHRDDYARMAEDAWMHTKSNYSWNGFGKTIETTILE